MMLNSLIIYNKRIITNVLVLIQKTGKMKLYTLKHLSENLNKQHMDAT